MEGHCFQFTCYLCYVKQQMVNCFIADSFSVYSYLIVIQHFAFWREIKKGVCLNSACSSECWCHLHIVRIKMCLGRSHLWCLFLDHQTCPLLLHGFMTLFLSYMCKKKKRLAYSSKDKSFLDFIWEHLSYNKKCFHLFCLNCLLNSGKPAGRIFTW